MLAKALIYAGGRKIQKDMVKYSCKNAKAGNVNLRCLKQRRFLHYNESAKEEFTMFQDNLKALRKKKGITQEELAARLNVVRQTVSKWEKGLSVPDSELLIKLAEILEVSVSRLLGSKIEEEEQPDDLAEQLSRINEQLAIKNRRARRVWKAIAFIVGGVIAVYVLILILATAFSFSPDQSGTTAGSSQSVETIVEKG